MAMADVLERPVAAPANRFPGGGAVRARRSAEPRAQGALLDVLIAHRAMLVNVARGFSAARAARRTSCTTCS